MDESERVDEGWRQVKAGLALLSWSKLVSWDTSALGLVAGSQDDFESPSGHRKVHEKFGRLICWVTFSTGAEYLAKGVCLLKRQELVKPKEVIRIPTEEESIDAWVEGVNADDPASKEPGTNCGTLGDLPPRLGSMLEHNRDRPLVLAAFKLLASAIRNRDAHRYAENTRAFHFHVVRSLLAPALNVLLQSLDPDELRARAVADSEL